MKATLENVRNLGAFKKRLYSEATAIQSKAKAY